MAYSQKSNFSNDCEFEKVSTDYLLNQQGHLLKKIGIDVKEVVTDRERQLEGIDIIADVSYKGRFYKDAFIDIKAVAGMIPTFSQEIENTGSGRFGWIMNNSLKTDFYLYVWHGLGKNDRGYSENKSLIVRNPDVIADNRLILIRKDEVQKIITERTGFYCRPSAIQDIEDQVIGFLGWETFTNSRKTEKMSAENGRIGVYRKGDDVYVALSNAAKIHEKPLNFIVRANVLAENGVSIIEKRADSDEKRQGWMMSFLMPGAFQNAALSGRYAPVNPAFCLSKAVSYGV